MKPLPLLLAVGAALLTGCKAGPNAAHEHWSADSVGPRMSRAFLGYRSDVDGEYIDFQWEKKAAINKTFMRHVLNHNPDNPFEMSEDTRPKQRPNHSLLPNPWNYIHVEGALMGAALYAAGTGVPIPIDSVIATFSEGGTEEFFHGIEETFDPAGVLLLTVLPGEEPGDTESVITGLSLPAGN